MHVATIHVALELDVASFRQVHLDVGMAGLIARDKRREQILNHLR